jgi:hypothetical protein
MGTTKQPDIIEGILARNRVHLIAGPSGVGKTTLKMQMVEAIATGSPFFGFPTTQVPILYVTADRTREEHAETCARVGVSMEKFGVRVVTMSDFGSFPLLYEILDKHARENYLVIVEPLPFFIVDAQNRPGNINDNTQVARFISALKVRCFNGKYTVAGSCHSPKAKEGGNYNMMREKIAGTSAWGAYTATNICMEMQDPNDAESPYRTVHFLLRNTKSFTKQFQFNPAGRLELCQPGKSNAWSQLDQELHGWPTDRSIETSDLEMWSGLVNCSRKTLFRWIDAKIASAELFRVDRGIYRKGSVVTQ